MGEVYRATDTNLDRQVAIKVLPDAIAQDPERVARFEREARTLATLNHPNIAIVHGFEKGDGVRALVMELVEGPTLADRLAQRPLPVDEALPIAKQIAEALEAAHEQGIVHRDLKPANIKVREDGTVKVLDFGLAKALESAPHSSDASQSPTITTPAVTRMGVILGTAAYMSPEQARGKPADKRADIWAFGCVLYEMLTGRQAFPGDEVSDVLASVLAREPDWTMLPRGLSPALGTYLKRCLDKDRKRRIGDIQSVRLALEGAFETAEPIRSSSRTVPLWPWGVAVVLAILLLLAIWKPRTPSSAAPPPMRLPVSLGAGEQLVVSDLDDGALAVLSPDGQTLVYRGTRDSVRRLYVRPLDSLESKPLSGTEEALSPFFSPDGRWIAFFSGGWLKKVEVSGGAPVPIAPAPESRGGTWGPDDTIVFAPRAETGLYRVAASSGTPVEMTKPVANERTHRWPSFLPDGNAVVFIRQDRNAAYDDGIIEAVRLETNERKILIRGGTFPRYLASGHLVYVRENTLFAVPFDARRLEVQVKPQPILYGVRSSGWSVGTGSSQVAFSSNGTVVYIADSAPGIHDRLVIVDRSGKPLFTYPETRQFRDPRFSPDGSRVALRMLEGKTSHVYVLDVERATPTKVTLDGIANAMPVWSPNGQQLAYSSDRGTGGRNIFLMRSDGTGEPEALTTGDVLKIPNSFSPNGHLLAAMQQDSASMDVVVLSLADRQLKPFAATPARETAPAFSPNGRWIAYQSDEDGTMDVYVAPYPGPGDKRRISVGGGVQPRWTKSGRELVYLAGPTMNRFMAVEIPEGDALRAGTPQLVFEMPVAHPSQGGWYDVSADGSRFVVLAADDDMLTHVTLVFGFFDEVRRMLAGR
jgi:eukaryotic-like serine/threonine-protein kinase